MPFSLIFTFFILLLDGPKFGLSAHGPSYYYDLCAPSTCGSSLLRFPLGINALCSSAYLSVSCENNTVYVADDENPGIRYRVLETLNVSVYAQRSIRLVDISISGCDPISLFPVQGSQKWQMVGNFHMRTNYQTGTFFNCTQTPPADMLPNMKRVPCLECGETANMCYFYDGYVDQIQNCRSSRLVIPRTMLNNNFSGVTNLRRALEVGFVVDWDATCAEACMDRTGGRCGFTDEERKQGNELCFCSSVAHKQNCSDGMIVSIGNSGGFRPRSKILTGVALGLFVLLACVFLVLLIQRRNKLKEVRLGGQDEQALRRYLATKNISIETFLQDFANGVPMRFSYRKIKRYTESFSHKLGQGGFGSVFKAKLPNGCFVAVKLLDETAQSEAQFLNEVRTVGQIHHNHLVRLVGFCFDQSRRALIYEYMENGSLDKYIHRRRNGVQQKLSWSQLYDIALGTARGVAYLHEECRSRILHCDIKPHNILLDKNFQPKVSDFGLAQMLNRDNSHISLTGGRGTPGYAPPEVWFKNHGPVTEKSDVYSYGMVVLEMVGERRNFEETSKSSETYFPQWVYVHHVAQQDGVGSSDAGSKWHECNSPEEERTARMMELVGLWCIQFSSSRRPTMRKVIEMLEGNATIDIPPMPFDGNIVGGAGIPENLMQG